MFCTNCGQYIGEGKAFCKYCGAPAVLPEETQEQTAEGPEPVSSEPTSSTFAPPPPPPAYSPVPPAEPVYAPAPPRRQRGLIAGVVAAVVVVLAGAGLGSYFLFFRGEDEGDLAGGSRGTAVTRYSTSSISTSIPESVTTLASEVTTQTVPSLTTSSQVVTTSATTVPTTVSSTTSTTEDLVEIYLIASGRVATELEEDDSRIPELAKIINATIPKIPQGVRTELVAMLNGLDRISGEMRRMVVPSPFIEAHYWLGEAVTHMTRRVQATIKGVEAVWAAGKVDAKANDFFDQGRKERDAYREAMQKYYDNLPLE